MPVDAVPVKTDVSDFPGLLRELVKPCLSEDWLDIHAIAEMTRCSARSLQRQLTAAGTNFSEVLDEARLEVAKPLLANESERLIDVAFEAGYTDPAHFSRAFRRIAGMTPSQYRKSKAFVRAA